MDGRQDEVSRVLEHAVAEAADAWLTAPEDHEAYRRLVVAVLARRAHGRPPSHLRSADAVEPADVAADELEDAVELEDADELAGRRRVIAVGEGLDPADPRAALERLRRGQI
ncbi:hypothetical protein [Pseudactinotalea suaedae]|uniref:hypothetical protein n=1 Tax=Pseudactinotalea suaedae TaxID=1524924 RepID=UPI0012E12314|nr:hypothetical protein [Pseudactinotalea suaedae]